MKNTFSLKSSIIYKYNYSVNIEKLYRKVKSIKKIEFRSIRARGASNDIIVGVGFAIDGKPPPDGKSRNETTPLSFCLGLF